MAEMVLLRDVAVDGAEVHPQRSLVPLQQQQFLVQVLAPPLLDAPELPLVEVLRAPQAVQLVVLLVLLHLPPVQHHKPELILRIEIPDYLQLLSSGLDLPQAPLEHALNYIAKCVLSRSLGGWGGKRFLPLRS